MSKFIGPSKIEDWISNNSWIKTSQLYTSGNYKDMINLPIINITDMDNIYFDDLVTMLAFWDIKKNFPIEIYIYFIEIMNNDMIDEIYKKDPLAIYSNKQNEIYNIIGNIFQNGITLLVFQSDNIELCFYAIDNNLINLEQSLIIACKYGLFDIIKKSINIELTVDDNMFAGILYECVTCYDSHKYEDSCIVYKIVPCTMFELSIFYGHINIVKYFIDKGIHMDYDKPLNLAGCTGRLDILKLLVENGANIHNKKCYILYFAIKNNHINIVQYLIDNNIDLNANGNMIYEAVYGMQNEDMILLLKQQHHANI